MATLFGRKWRRQEILTYIGDISQVGGIRRVMLDDGPERGVRAADVGTGSGFNFTVLLDRGMDIGFAEYRGIPLTWISPTGPSAPAFYDPRGTGWLRTFHGGLLTTCGLTQVGVPNVDLGEDLGLHGRISHIPARQVSCQEGWEGDEYRLRVEGNMREVSVFGHDLRLTRRVTATLGQSKLIVEDMVENMGHEPAPHMIMYHCNMGFPLLSPGSRLVIPSLEAEPRDDMAAQGLASHTSFEDPTPNYAEQCFFHTFEPDPTGHVSVQLINPDLGLTLQLRFRHRELPEMVQWKQMGLGTYVLGLEPANCRAVGRSAAREQGKLIELAPGEVRDYFLEMTVLTGATEDG